MDMLITAFKDLQYRQLYSIA